MSKTSKTVVNADDVNIKGVFPTSPVVAINGSIKLTAIVTDKWGEYLQSTSEDPVIVSWSSSDSQIATISQSGTVIGKKEGVAIIKLKASNKNNISQEYSINVVVVSIANDVSEIYLSPDRAYIDIGAERTFKLTAVDYFGAQTSISPGVVTFDISDKAVASISPEVLENNDSKSIIVTGKQKGYVFITPIYTVMDEAKQKSIKITGTPLVVQVKDATESSKPQDDTVDAGNYLTMAVRDNEGKKILHIAHYDKSSNDLMYSFFNGTWHSETVATSAGKGVKLQISPFDVNYGQPLLLFLENNRPKLWSMEAIQNNWIDTTIFASISTTDLFNDANPLLEGEKVLDMSAFEGEGNTTRLHILFYDKIKDRINLTTSSMTQNSWFDWSTKLSIDLDKDLQSLSVANNHILGDARFAYILKESNASAKDGGVYYASQTGSVIKTEKIPNTNGSEKNVVLRLDSNNVPTIVWNTNSEVTIVTRVVQSGKFTWMTKNISIEPRPSLIDSVDFNFDAYNTPRIVFNTDKKIRYSRRITTTSGQDSWIVESPEESLSQQGAYTSIAVDSANRAHLVYTDSEDKWFSYWAEPNFFDYRVYPGVQDIQADIVGK